MTLFSSCVPSSKLLSQCFSLDQPVLVYAKPRTKEVRQDCPQIDPVEN